jgi:triacylglycerol esterase/lipase EstA (alpha/beta hydrolase family)
MRLLQVYKGIDKLASEGRIVTRFSVFGYSMGGLIARYLLGVLRARNFFDNIAPVNFTTFATPHIGVPRYPGFLSSIVFRVGPRMLSVSGEQFFHTDSWGTTGRPLLAVMADPSK